ncbi:MAG: phosphoserine phosphatase SerB, partial [Alphaproteobacteria bacterium]
EELAPEEAADIVFQADEPLPVLRRRLFAATAGRAVDVIVQPRANRRKMLLIADMDSTMIQQECIDELADFAGTRAEVAAITERAMRGEIDYEPALWRRARLMKGLEVGAIDKVLGEHVDLTPGARDLVWTMRANGARTLLVSGGFIDFVEPVARRIGFNEAYANRLEIADGRLTGGVVEPILGRTAKLAALEDAIIRGNLDAQDTLAVGDGANDMAMIARAGLGVAYHAKPRVAAVADARIEHGDLSALLYAQGYRKDEFVR